MGKPAELPLHSLVVEPSLGCSTVTMVTRMDRGRLAVQSQERMVLLLQCYSGDLCWRTEPNLEAAGNGRIRTAARQRKGALKQRCVLSSNWCQKTHVK